MSDFVNTPTLDFRRPAVRDQVGAAVAELDARLPLAAPVRIGDGSRAGAFAGWKGRVFAPPGSSMLIPTNGAVGAMGVP